MANGNHKLQVVLTLACDACGSTNIIPGDALCARCKRGPKSMPAAANNDNDLVVVAMPGAPRSSPIPAPTMADGFTADEIERWHAAQRVLNADPRTAGSMPRPRRMVERVLREASWTPGEVAELAGGIRRRVGVAS